MSHEGSATVVMPSERKFGLVFCAIFLALAAWGGLIRDWSRPAVLFWSLGGVAFLVLALAAPAVLRPLNRAWFQLGLLLGRIVSPIVLGLMFFLLITPVALVTRAMGRDVLRIKPRQTTTYWIDREPSDEPPDESFKHQF